MLLEMVVGTDPDFNCMHNSSEVTFVAAPTALLAFLLIVGKQ